MSESTAVMRRLASDSVHLANISFTESPVRGFGIRVDLLRRGRAGDDRGDRLMREKPGDRQLKDRVSPRFRKLDEPFQRSSFSGVILSLPARRLFAGALVPLRYLPVRSPLASGK